MRHLLGTLFVAAVLLTGGCSSYDEDDQITVETYCGITEDVDEYDNPDGWDRCIEDNLPNAERYNECADEEGLDDVAVLTDEYRRIDALCDERAGWF